jgi:hypothetical protein
VIANSGQTSAAKLPEFASTAALTLLDRPDRALHTSPTKKPHRNNSTHPSRQPAIFDQTLHRGHQI